MTNDPAKARSAAEINEFNRGVIAEFRASGGAVGGVLASTPMMLLTHTGAKSGASYTSPLACSRDGDDIVIIASMRGAPVNPQWFANIVANPEVGVEVDGDSYQARARVARGDERERLYAAQAAIMPVFDEYRAKTTREIPVVVLERL